MTLTLKSEHHADAVARLRWGPLLCSWNLVLFDMNHLSAEQVSCRWHDITPQRLDVLHSNPETILLLFSIVVSLLIVC